MLFLVLHKCHAAHMMSNCVLKASDFAIYAFWLQQTVVSPERQVLSRRQHLLTAHGTVLEHLWPHVHPPALLVMEASCHLLTAIQQIWSLP